MSKTYRRTKKGRKIDWLPNNRYFNLFDIDESEEELIHLIKTTKVYKEVRTYFVKLMPSGEYKECSRIVHVNRFLLRSYVTKLQALQWIKNNPHRKNDKGDYFDINYSKSPSNWNHDHSTVPRRAKDRDLLTKIKKEEIDLDEVNFLDGKKPVIYYY